MVVVDVGPVRREDVSDPCMRTRPDIAWIKTVGGHRAHFSIVVQERHGLGVSPGEEALAVCRLYENVAPLVDVEDAARHALYLELHVIDHVHKPRMQFRAEEGALAVTCAVDEVHL